jgi:hypothetical protein
MRAPRRAALALLGLSGCLPHNPPVGRPVAWDSPQTEALARRACMDCHSHETHWPWTTRVPGVGALIKSDVARGRAHLNFSTWDRPGDDADEAAEALAEGEMPLALYLRAHPNARLSPAERAALIAGLERTLAADPPGGQGDRGDARPPRRPDQRDDPHDDRHDDDPHDDDGRSDRRR